MEKKRIEWIDALRGAAILLVVIGHIADGCIDANIFPEYSQVLRNIYNGIYMFHMALFFALSGMAYQIAYIPSTGITDPDSRKRIRKQIINLVLLYIIYSIANWALKQIFAGNVNKPVSLTDLLLIFGKPIYLNWYFYVLIVFYALFMTDSIRNFIPMEAAFAFLFVVSLASGFVDTSGWFQIRRIMYYAVFFWLGMKFISDPGFIVFRKPVTAICFVVSAVLAAIWWNRETMICDTPIVSTFVAFGIVLALIRVFSGVDFLDRGKGLLNYLGKHSLEIYVIHSFLTAGNRVLLPKIGIHGFWLSVVCNLVISTGVSLLISGLFREIGIWDVFFRPYRVLARIKNRFG